MYEDGVIFNKQLTGGFNRLYDFDKEIIFLCQKCIPFRMQMLNIYLLSLWDSAS